MPSASVAGDQLELLLQLLMLAFVLNVVYHCCVSLGNVYANNNHNNKNMQINHPAIGAQLQTTAAAVTAFQCNGIN